MEFTKTEMGQKEEYSSEDEHSLTSEDLQRKLETF